jgi:pyridoxal phosphate enzyme (YggS family)
VTDPRERKREIAANLADVRHRVRRACHAVGREPVEITLIAVTKTFPADDLRILASLGVLDLGENRDGEAAAKVAELADDAASGSVRWHFVGQVQTRKARSVAKFAHVVHSVDRVRLVVALDRAAAGADRTLRALVQVALAGDDGGGGRGGVQPAEVEAVAAAIATAEYLELGGIMAVAPPAKDPAPAFAQLAQIAALVRRDHPTATDVSAGMSADLEAAVAAGATHLRVGSALLGRRPPLR